MLYDMLAGGVMVTDRSGHMWWSTERREGGMAVLGYIAVASTPKPPPRAPTSSGVKVVKTVQTTAYKATKTPGGKR